MIGFKDVQCWRVSCYGCTNVPQKRNISINTCSAISYLGNTNFRFHFTCFASTDASAFKLYLVFWKAVNYLAVFGFTFLSMNGEQSTRDIMNILLSHKDTGSFTINNIFNPYRPKISIIRDFSYEKWKKYGIIFHKVVKIAWQENYNI